MLKMVKSFQGERASDGKQQISQKSLVSDFMTTKLITFRPQDSMEEVMNKLVKHKISGGPVVNESNELVGIISEGDCLKEITKRKYHNSPESVGMVKDHMATNIETISPDTDIFDAAQQFLSKHFRRFPVLRDGKLVGQISQKDIMKAVLNLKSNTW